ncbi:MAG TPA: type II toxin-antitoxin system VapC family toxin [Kofleriaceae bacterium]|nr:type II toxin-antitoxin system VapC family toxin [Kofleriaceae bacterium]
MKLLLDTNVCISIMNRDERVRRHLEQHAPSALRMSAITLAELRFGAAKSTQPRRAVTNLNAILSKIGVVPFDDAATARYGELRALLERRGSPIGPLDTLIAAHALSLRWTLATHNVREFRRVPGLGIDDWLA